MNPAVTLYPYQRAWLTDRARFKAGCFARQTGKTFTTTLEIVDDCAEAAARGQRRRWVVLSRGERQAAEAINEGVKRHAQAYQMVAEATEVPFWGAGAVAYRALEVTLPGGKITALPANPDTARGYSASVFLDEFAFHEKSREIWAALFPVISAGHRLRITSTPNGKGNKFYEIMTGPPTDGWSRHWCDIHRAAADGLPRDVGQLRAALGDEQVWAQEYELDWADETASWLPMDLITSGEHPDAGTPSGYQGGLCWVGVDVAIRRDLWVAAVFETVGDVQWCRELVALRGGTFAEREDVLVTLDRRYRVARFALDQSGQGEQPVERARLLLGAHRVEGVFIAAAPRALAVATALKAAFQDRRVRIPPDPLLRRDLHAVRAVHGTTGVRLSADRDANGHADRFWAVGLALAAAAGGTASYDYQPIRSGATRDFWRASDEQPEIGGAAWP